MSIDIWTFADIRTATRRYAKLKDSTAFSDADIDKAINQYYMFRFVLDVRPMELMDEWTFNTTATDDTESLDDDTIVTITDRGTVDGYRIDIFFDREAFYDMWTPTATVANNRPYQALFYGGVLTMRPTPDDTYAVIIPSWVRPLELVNATDRPTREEWGPLISIGAARMLVGQFGDEKRHAFLTKLYEEEIAKIQGKALKQMSVKRIKPQW